MLKRWKNPIDWINDPTGATDLVGAVCVAPWGVDDPGSGSSTQPFRTINYAVSQRGIATYYLYEGYYELTGNIASIAIIGEGKSSAFINANGYLWTTRNNSDNRGFTFENGSINLYNSRAYYCNFLDSLVYGHQSNLTGFVTNSLLINCTTTRDLRLARCILKNFSGPVRNSSYCYYDENCTGVTIVETSTNDNVRTGAFGAYNLDPLFNNEAGGDFSLQPNSPHIQGNGTANDNIGGTVVSNNSWYNGSPDSLFTDMVNASPDVEFNGLGEVAFTAAGLAKDSIRLVSPVLTADAPKYLPTPNYSGFPQLNTDVIPTQGSPEQTSDDELILYEERWAGVNENIEDKAFYPFRWGEEPKWDALANGGVGASNGQEGFSYASSRGKKIPHLQRQYAITLLKAGLNGN